MSEAIRRRERDTHLRMHLTMLDTPRSEAYALLKTSSIPLLLHTSSSFSAHCERSQAPAPTRVHRTKTLSSSAPATSRACSVATTEVNFRSSD